MSRRRRHRGGWTLIVVLILIDLALGVALFDAHGVKPIVIALAVALVLGLLSTGRRRTRRGYR